MAVQSVDDGTCFKSKCDFLRFNRKIIRRFVWRWWDTITKSLLHDDNSGMKTSISVFHFEVHTHPYTYTEKNSFSNARINTFIHTHLYTYLPNGTNGKSNQYKKRANKWKRTTRNLTLHNVNTHKKTYCGMERKNESEREQNRKTERCSLNRKSGRSLCCSVGLVFQCSYYCICPQVVSCECMCLLLATSIQLQAEISRIYHISICYMFS